MDELFQPKKGGSGSYSETDPTVPAWAKEPNKPSYDIGGTNIIPDSADLSAWISGYYNGASVSTSAITITSADIQGLNVKGAQIISAGLASGNGDALKTLTFSTPLTAGKYTISVMYYADSGSTADGAVRMLFYAYTGSTLIANTTAAVSVADITYGQWRRISANVTIPDGCTAFRIQLALRGNGNVIIALPRLEKGEIATDWTPCPTDLPMCMQTGKVTTANGTATVTFARAFAAAPVVTATAVGAYVSVSGVTATGFTVNTSTATANVVNWIAAEV